MRDDMNPFSPSPVPTPAETPAPADSPVTPAADAVLVNPAVIKFKSCRWRCAPEDGEFCTHRDVLKADSWCPECAFYKLRRTPKKREWVDRNSY